MAITSASAFHSYRACVFGTTALAHDACRFVLTEGCLTRLQQIIATTKILHTTPDRAIAAGQRTPLIGA